VALRAWSTLIVCVYTCLLDVFATRLGCNVDTLALHSNVCYSSCCICAVALWCGFGQQFVLACSRATTHLFASVMLVGGVLAPRQPVAMIHSCHSVPVSRICTMTANNAVTQQSNIAVLVSNAAVQCFSCRVLHALAPIYQALICYVSSCHMRVGCVAHATCRSGAVWAAVVCDVSQPDSSARCMYALPGASMHFGFFPQSTIIVKQQVTMHTCRSSHGQGVCIAE
jgi:hypothetical protein